MELIKRTLAERTMDAVNATLLLLFSATILYPFLQQITISLSSPATAAKAGLHLFPTEFVTDSYKEVFSDGRLGRAYGNTLFVVAAASLLTLALSCLTAYPLSRRYLPNRRLWTGLCLFTMYFSGGLIPSYLLIKSLGLVNSLWVLVLPGGVNVFYVIILRNFFMVIPDSLIESATIDGETDIGILIKIVLPLSLPSLATILLWCAVDNWNAWFAAMLYINDERKQVLQLLIRNLLSEQSASDINAAAGDASPVTADGVRAATILLTTAPILCVYPFLQRYFVSGLTAGAVKG